MKRLGGLIFGQARDPLDPEISRRVLLAAMLGWVGLGANGLSSACYGPEKAYVALGVHTELGPFLALATTVTVFVIAVAYSQVMEIFPSGGGSYRIASQLLGPKFGLVSGSAQVVDYVLTIAPLLLGNMATDSWLPHRFRNLSSRLVREDGVVFIGACAIAILLWTNGELGLLVVFYSINVFLCLTLSKLGLCRYWWNRRGELSLRHLLARLVIATAGLVVALVVLLMTLQEKFFEGGWATICLTLLVVASGIVIRRQYDWVSLQRQRLDKVFELPKKRLSVAKMVPPDPAQSTAIFLTTNHWGPTLHTLLWVHRIFHERFRNWVFVSAVEVQASVLSAPETVPDLKAGIERALDQLEAFCANEGLSTARFIVHGTDPVKSLEDLIKEASAHFPDSVCFANKLILPANRWFAEWLHNQTALGLQRQLHLEGIPLVILPIKLI